MVFFTQAAVIPKSIAALLIVVMVANLALFGAIFHPSKAEAAVFHDAISFARDVVQFIWEKAQKALDKAAEVAKEAKEDAFKFWERFKSNNGVIAELVAGLLTVMMHQILAKLTNDIVAWINGGGKGKIRVLQDPGKFLADALDEAGGVLAGAILNVDPSTLCNPDFLKFKLKAAFTGPYAQQTFDEQVACTFTGMGEGLQKFKEDFTKGGWQSFIELSRKENNQIGQTLIVANESQKIAEKKTQETQKKIEIGKGYLSQEKCIITKTIAGGETTSYYASLVESGAQTEEFTEEDADEAAGMAFRERQYYAQFVGKNVEDVEKALNNGMTGDGFKKWWQSQGGEITCKTVTPGEQISELANKALQAPIKRLEDAISAMTNKLGTGAGSVLKPYVLAIANAGINLMLNKGYGLITNAITPQKKTRKTQRQVTSSLQEHAQIAQSAEMLSGSVTSFRSFLLKAMVDFSIFAATAEKAIDNLDVLGRISLNKVEVEKRGGPWYLTYNNAVPPSPTNSVAGMMDCPPGYFGTGVGHACNGNVANNGTVVDPHANVVYTKFPGRVFFEEAKWCGAFSQEIPIPSDLVPVVEDPKLIVSPPTSPCPTLRISSSLSYSGNCTAAPGWVSYDIDGDGQPEMLTRIAAYDDKKTEKEDRFIRQNIIGAINDTTGLPAGNVTTASPITFEETLINTFEDKNRDSVLSDIATSTTVTAEAGSRGLFEMHPHYSQQIFHPETGGIASLSPGIAEAAVASSPSGSGYIFGGYNQFGFSSRILSLSTGAFVANLPVALAGSAAVYYPPNGRIYVFGGFNSTTIYNTIWEFNPSTNAVRSMSARLPSPATGLSVAYYPPNGRIYLFGGNNNGTISNQILEYNQATDTLITKNATFPSPLAFTAAATAGTGASQRIYVFGGIDDLGYSSPAIFEYNPNVGDTSSALIRKGTNIESRGFLSAVRDNANHNFINVYGGQSEYGHLIATERYNTLTDSLAPLSLLSSAVSKAGYGATSATTTDPALAGGIVPVTPTTADPESAKIFPQGDIYYIPAHINAISVTKPFWQKYFSPTFANATVSLLNTRDHFSYSDFTATIANTTITSVTNEDGNRIWLSKPYPELYEIMQELQEKIRIIKGYNYPSIGEKNYTSPLADQLGSTPDDDPFDDNPNNLRYQRGNVSGIKSENDCVFPLIWDAAQNKCYEEGYKGSVTDVLTRYNNLAQTYQALFAGIADENTLEGVDKDFTILSPEETNIKFAMIGKRCPVLAPSATSTPDLIANCPKFDGEYNMARRFIFESDDIGANPTGITTGFATNPFTGAKSSALAGLLNLDEMASQLQVLPPDKNIIKLIRLRQILEQLQITPQPIPLPGKTDAFLNPKPLSGVDIIQVSLPGYEHIQAYLNDTTTKNLGIQTLIAAYGYTNAKDAYPEISKQLDDIFDDIINQVTDDLKETFLKRIDEQLEEAKVNAQYRLERFIEYIRDINPTVKIEVDKQRGDQFLGLPGANIRQISADTSLIQINTEQMFIDNGNSITALLSRNPLRLTNEERQGIIGSAIYKIKAMNEFLGFDITTPAFAAQFAQYTAISGSTIDEYNANLDNNVRMVLKDAYMLYAGIYNQNDQLLPAEKRTAIQSCGRDEKQGYFCDLEVVSESKIHVRIFKDMKTKLEELKNDFSLMTAEVSSVIEEFQTLISDVESQKMEMEDFVKLLSTLEADYDKANSCIGLPVTEIWKLPSNTSALLGSSVPVDGIITKTIISTAIKFSVVPILGTLVGAIWGWFSGKKKKREAERRERERQNTLNKCKEGVASFNKHLGQLADQFVCGKINPIYED